LQILRIIHPYLPYLIINYRFSRGRRGHDSMELPVQSTLCDKVCQWLATGRWFSPGIQFPPPIKLTFTV